MKNVIKKIDECVLFKDFSKALHMLNNLIFYIENLNENYDGQLAFLYYYKASILTLTENLENALECIIKACELDSENIKYLVLKSNIYDILGDSDNAFKVYIRVLEKYAGAIEDKEAYENAIKYAKELYTNYQNGEFTKEGLFDHLVSLYKEKEYKISEKIIDYQSFAQSLSYQAESLIPDDITEKNGNYICEKIKTYAIFAGKSCINDKDINYSEEQYTFIIQVIAEWTFHKSVDLIRSGIPSQHWDNILQKIVFATLEVAKQGIIKNIHKEQLLQDIENQVIKTYKSSIEELKQNGVINEEIKKKAESQSNIDKMAQ